MTTVETHLMLQQILDAVRVNNSEILELKEDVKILKEDVGVLKQDVSNLKQEVSDLREEVSDLREDLNNFKIEVNQRFDRLEDAQYLLNQRVFDQEVDIRILKEAKAV